MIFRGLYRIIEQISTFTYLTWLLLLIVLGSLATGLNEAIDGFDGFVMLPLLVIGLFLSWGLAKLRLPDGLAGIMALSLGLEILLIQVGQLWDELGQLPRASFALAQGLWHWSRTGVLDLSHIFSPFNQLAENITVLLLRLGQWLGALLGDTPTFDPIAATIVWGFLLWGVAVWAGWVVRRYANPVLALTPAGFLLVTISAHFRDRLAPLIFFLGATLLLMALVKQHARERNWERRKISFSPELHLDLGTFVLFTTIGLLAISSLVATTLFDPLNSAIQTYIWGQARVARSTVARSLGIRPTNRASTALDPMRRGGLPRSHLLGSGPELSKQVVMIIQTNDPPANHSRRGGPRLLLAQPDL